MGFLSDAWDSATGAVTSPFSAASSFMSGDWRGGLGHLMSGWLGQTGFGMIPGVNNALQGAIGNNKGGGVNIPTFAKPGYPGHQSLLVNNQLPDEFKLNMNKAPIEAVRSQAMSEGITPWAQMQLNNLRAGAGARKQELQDVFSGQSDTIRNQMLSTGLSQGAKNRLGKKLDLEMQLGQQRLNRADQGLEDLLLSTDTQEKQQMLQSLPGLELTALRPQQFNIANYLEEKRLADLADSKRYESEMQAWATANTAKATQDSGKK